MARTTQGSVALLLAATLTAGVGWGDTVSAAVARGEGVSRWQGRWYVASPTVLGFDSTRLTAAISNIGRMRGVQGFLLARSGYLVEEHYWRGGARDKPHNLKSASKSIISALVGIAIAKGYFRLDQPIADLLPQASLLKDPAKRGITVRQLLTMTSGLQSTSYEAYDDWVRNRDWVTAALRQPLATPPGTEYRYSTGNTHMLSAILAASTGKPTREFAEQQLFRPMEVEVAGWQKDPNGIHLGGNNFSLQPRDAAKFGQLYLDNGRWRNRQLVPKSWIAASTRPTDNGPHETYGNYGFLWWTQPPADGSFAAVGYGGQYILVSPRHDSVVVVLSNVVSKGDRWEARLFELIKRGVLDSLMDPQQPPSILLGAAHPSDGGRTREPVTAIAAANVNLRAEPNLNARRLALIPEGSQLELLERNDAWVRGRINGQAGWLHWDYIDWFSLRSEDFEFSPVAIAERDADADGVSRAQTHITGTNNWKIIGGTTHEQADRAINSLQTNDSLVGDDKIQVTLRSRIGRVRAQLQDLQTLLNTTSSASRYRTTARINLRHNPSLNGTSLRLIEPETEFQVLGHHGPWLKANIDGAEGWLHSEFVQVVESTPAVADQDDLATELAAVGESVRQLLATQRVNESQVAAAKRSMEDMERELERTLGRLQNVELERVRLDKERKAKTEELVVLGITHRQRAQELDTARKKIATLEDTLQKEQTVKKALATDLASVREEFQASSDQLARYTATQTRRGRELETALARITKLEGVLQQEQASKHSLAEELGSIRDQSDTQRRQLEQLGADQEQRTLEIDAAREQIAKLEGALQQEQASKHSLAEELGSLRDQSDTQRQQLEQLGADQERRTQELDAARDQIAKLEGALQQEQVSKHSLAEVLGRIRDQSDTQRQQLEQLGADQERRTLEIDAARDQIAKLEGALQREQASKRSLAEELGSIRDQSETQRQQFERVSREEQASKHTLAAKMMQLIEERRRESQRLELLDARHKKDAKQFDALRIQFAQLERAYRSEQASKGALADELARLEVEREALRRKVDELAAAERQRAEELTTARIPVIDIERTLQQQQGEKRTFRAQISELEQALQQEQTAKQKLTADLTRLREENETQNQRLEHLDAAHKQSIKELDAVRTELAEIEGQQISAVTEDIAMSERLEYQSAGRSTTAEPRPDESLATTASSQRADVVSLDVTADVNAVVNAWATAWSEQDVGAYLAFYSQEFRPAGGATRTAWETLRRRRLMRPAFIEVSVADVEITLLGLGRAQATFRQAYRADRYQDKVLKTLELARESDQWRIVRETSR